MREPAHKRPIKSRCPTVDVEDLARVRTAIETQCLVWAMENGSLDWESNIVAATHRLLNSARELDKDARPPTWNQAHSDYHVALVGDCGFHATLAADKRIRGQQLCRVPFSNGMLITLFAF
jgi:DNA-binding GntR family transcriptional regulator